MKLNDILYLLVLLFSLESEYIFQQILIYLINADFFLQKFSFSIKLKAYIKNNIGLVF